MFCQFVYYSISLNQDVYKYHDKLLYNYKAKNYAEKCRNIRKYYAVINSKHWNVYYITSTYVLLELIKQIIIDS